MAYGEFELFDEKGAKIYSLLDLLRVFQWAYRVAKSIVKRLLEPPAAVLEIGPGLGRLAAMLAEDGYRVVGVDISLAMLKRALRRTAPDFVNGGSWRLPLRRNSFDLAIALFTVHHWGSDELSSASVYEALKPGGVFVVIEADKRRVPLVGSHGSTPAEIESKFSSKFEVKIERKFPLLIAYLKRAD